jgi:uncharacterized protein (DUF2164 family)
LLGPTEHKIIKVLRHDIPRTRRQIVQETGLSQKKVDNALFRLLKAGRIVRSEKPLREYQRIFKGRGGTSSNLRNYYLYILRSKKKRMTEINGVTFARYERRKKSKPKESKAKILLSFLRDNKGIAFYSKEILDRLRNRKLKPSDIMTNVRLFEKKGLVYVRGYRTDSGQTPFREGYLITWIDHDKPRETALEEAIQATNKVLANKTTKNPIVERIQTTRDQIIEATKLKDLISFDFLQKKLSCSLYEAESAIKRALQLYPDLREIKIFGNFRYYFHVDFAQVELHAAVVMKENYIRKIKGRANRIGHNWEAAVEFFIDNLTTGAKFWTQNHKNKEMDSRRITVYLVKSVAGRRKNAEVDRVWEVSPGPLLSPTTYVLECKWGLVRKQDVDHFFEVLRNSKEFGIDTPEGRQIKQGVVGVFSGSAFNPNENVRLKDETEISLASYAARVNIQLLKISDFNEKLRQKGCPKGISVQKICKLAKDENETRKCLELIWQNPSKADEVLADILRENRGVYEFENLLENIDVR